MALLKRMVLSSLLITGLAAAAPPMLVFAKSKDAKTLDPGLIDEGNSSMVVNQIFETLLRYKPGTVQLEPGLAESMPDISKNGLEETFHIRKGVQFHDGTPSTPTRWCSRSSARTTRTTPSTSSAPGNNGTPRAGPPPTSTWGSSRTSSRWTSTP